jgi:hypothetical protein
VVVLCAGMGVTAAVAADAPPLPAAGCRCWWAGSSGFGLEELLSVGAAALVSRGHVMMIRLAFGLWPASSASLVLSMFEL